MRLVERFSSPAQFQRACLETSVPGVLAGGIADWPAVTKWTPDSLAERLGDRTCRVAHSSKRVFDYQSATSARRDMSFREAARKIVARRPEDDSLYIMQIPLDRELPELRDDIAAPAALDGVQAFPFFWMGAAGNVTPVHFDGVNNLFGQVFGRKRFTLFDPADTPRLYPRAPGTAESHLGSVDVENTDLARYPDYRDARPILCDLHPGDLLFLPAFFWHHVRSIDAAISVNYWWAPTLEQCFNPAFMGQLRACYRADRLKSIGAPIGTCSGGLAEAADRALRCGAPGFAALLAGAAIEELTAGASPPAAFVHLRAWLPRLAEPVAAGADCSPQDAARMIRELRAALPAG